MTPPSDVYTDIVGDMQRRWPPSYDAVITKACPNCGAQPGDVCTYTPAQRTRRAPCVARIK
jgi:hypothetical protein